jgi:hypothetical protein
MLEMNTIPINNRKFDSATSQSRWNLEDLFYNAIELAFK